MQTYFEKLNEKSDELDRDKIIAALRQLEDVADEKGYTAEDLIDAVENGF